MVAAGCGENENSLKVFEHSPILLDSVNSGNNDALDKFVNNTEFKFVEEFMAKGFGTDTNRLYNLVEYAYRDLRKSPFVKVDGILFTELNVRNSEVLNRRKADGRDSLFINSLENGKGFYFVKIDSLGNGLKNSFDFGLEIWDFKGGKLSRIKSYWEGIYHPMPLYIETREDKMFVFYTRSSINYKILQEQMKIILKN